MKEYDYSDSKILDGDERLEIIGDMILYEQTNPKFDLTFVFSCEKSLKENGYLSDKQYNSLVKTYKAFKM